MILMVRRPVCSGALPGSGAQRRGPSRTTSEPLCWHNPFTGRHASCKNLLIDALSPQFLLLNSSCFPSTGYVVLCHQARMHIKNPCSWFSIHGAVNMCPC